MEHSPQKQTVPTVDELVSDIRLSLVWSDLAHEYMGHGARWIHDRMRGRTREGEPVEFTPEELEQLRGALCDFADRIRRAADKLAPGR